MNSNGIQTLKYVLVAVLLAGGMIMLPGCSKSLPAPSDDEVGSTEPGAESDNQVTDKTPPIKDADNASTIADDSSTHKNPQGVIALETRWEGGVLTMPCTVNGLRLRFIFDTGASSVCISSTEALFMLKNGYLDESDIGGEVKSVIANGDIVDSTEITLRTVEVGGIVLKDVEAIVSHELEAPLLFGQSAIRQLGTIQIRDGEVTILPGTGSGVIEDLSNDNEVMKTPLWRQAVEKKWIIEVDGEWVLGDGNGKALEKGTNGMGYRRSETLPVEGFVVGQYLLGAIKGTPTISKAEYMSLLGYEFAEGTMMPQDFAEAFRWYHMAAEQGDAKGQFYTGAYYHKGMGVRQDKAEARRWYAMAAAQGDSPAQYNLALLYYFGEGGRKDQFEAAIWFRRAAEQGHSGAQFNLGLMYDNGEGVAKNKQQALYWYQKAAEQGDAGALNNLALMYENGIGVAKNKREALRLYKQAADIGSDKGEQNYRRLLREKEEHDRRVREDREYERWMRSF